MCREEALAVHAGEARIRLLAEHSAPHGRRMHGQRFHTAEAGRPARVAQPAEEGVGHLETTGELDAEHPAESAHLACRHVVSFVGATVALYLTTALVVIFGCIFLGSSSAFNAIISASVVALGVSYAIPIAINCLQGRKKLPPRPFVLPNWFAWFANLLGIAYVIVTTVLFVFPPELPVTGSNMSEFLLPRHSY